MPVDRRTGRDNGSSTPGYSSPAQDPSTWKSRCTFIGTTGQCGLRGNIGMGAGYACTFHDEKLRTHPGRAGVVSNGTFVEFISWRQQKIDEGDTRWEKHNAEWWWKRITGEECP